MSPHPKSADRCSQLHAELLSYAQSPGKFNVALRQPTLLFASIPEILHLAAGRESDAGTATNRELASLREPACFFVRTALLHPDADHYALLGLERISDIADLKERYRLVMRLIHPDFSGTAPVSWPDDAAARVNQAYEVLSSATRRRQYEVRLADKPRSPVAKVEHHRPKARATSRGFWRSRLKQLLTISGVAGACAILISLLMLGPERGNLVQRVRPPPVEPVVVAVRERAEPAVPTAPPTLATPAAMTVQPAKSRALALASAPVPVPAPSNVIALEQTVAIPAASMEGASRPAPVTVAPQAAAPSRPPPVAELTLAEAQPLLTILLQHLESGHGERVINLLDREARNAPNAQALLRQYSSLVGSARPVRLSQVEFRAQPADGRLLVTGHLRLQVGESGVDSPGKMMVLRAEFVSRNGTVVMTGLSSVADN